MYAHFFFSGKIIPEVLEKAFKTLIKQNGRKKVLDLGCGDGALMRDLLKEYNLEKKFLLIGVDISKEACLISKKRVPKAKIIQANAIDLPFNTNYFDLIYSWMVIEHVVDQEKMVAEAHRVLKKQGIFVIGTILRKKIAFYIHRKNGRFILDPTHVREYTSSQELTSLLIKNGFKVRKLKISRRSYPLLELILRGLIKLHILSPTLSLRDVFLNNKLISWLRQLILIPIPGYFQMEILAQK